MAASDHSAIRGSAVDSTAKVALTIAALIGAAIVSVFLVFRLADYERTRERQTWQTQLGIIADSRAAAVDGWLAAQFNELEQLAGDPATQLYMTQITRRLASAGGATADLGAEAEYLRNLLTVIAHRARFSAEPVGPGVDANLPRVGIAGIALIDTTARVVASSPGFPQLDGRLGHFARSANTGQRGLLDLHLDAHAGPAMGFSVPVFAVQGDRGSGRQIGQVIAIKPVAGELYPLLAQPGMVWASAEAVLVRVEDDAVAYLSPTRDGGQALRRRLALDTAELAAAFALRHPGGFAEKRDYRGADVLVTGRRLQGVPWTLMFKIDRDEAFADSDARLRRLIVVALMAIAVIGAALAALWRHGASRRASAAATRYRRLARRYGEQERLLRLVTNSQPDAMFISDSTGRFVFANRMAAQAAGIAPEYIIGKPMVNVLGPASAARYKKLNAEALWTGETVVDISRTTNGAGIRVVRSEHIPIRKGNRAPGEVLVVEQDITPVVNERERRERTLRQLVRTLVTVVDRRDPYAADHSARVALVARAIAEEIELDAALIETVEIAGQLMNIGKILIPSEILTRPRSLSEDEMRQVRESIRASTELLSGIEFDGPVVDTLDQLGEHWDGSGQPMGLKGDQILITARIVAVANVFVAMTSARAWRPEAAPDEALDALLGDVGKRYDRRVVAALINRFDKRGSAKAWAPPQAAALA